MLFIRHVTTRAMRGACFPDDDEADPASLARAREKARVLPAGDPDDVPPGEPADVGTDLDEDAAGNGGTAFGGEPARVAWVSPATAAAQTALALGMVPRVAVELAEADAGRWRGLPYAWVAEEEPEALAAWLADPDAAPHEGESIAAMSARVGAWIEAMRDTPDVVVLCDVGVIRAALGHALGIRPAATARFDIAPLSSTEIAPAGEGWRVVRVNHVDRRAAT